MLNALGLSGLSLGTSTTLQLSGLIVILFCAEVATVRGLCYLFRESKRLLGVGSSVQF